MRKLFKFSKVELDSRGLYGTAVGCMGMLSTVAYVLAMDVFGPITDNAGGIVEMSEQPPSERESLALVSRSSRIRFGMTKVN